MSAWFQSGLAAPDPAVRGRALKELAKLNPTKKVGPLVRNALADPDPTVRAAAAEAINTLASQVNLKALRKLVDEKGNPDPHHLVRLRATETLLAPRGEQ
jgi:HEAT repeat protein